MTRTALVTGGSRGIGAAIVREFAGRGVDVVFTYRGAAAAAEKVVADCDGTPGRATALPYDLLTSDPRELIASVGSLTHGLDALVLNAGVWAGGRLSDMDHDEWWDVVEANLRGAGRLAAAAVPAVTASGQGSITFVSSAVALIGFPGDTAYASAKAGMIGMARSLAKELGATGTRVNVLAPGFVDTDMTAQIPDRSRTKILDAAQLRRFGTAEEIARAAVFLAADATYCTGAVLAVDGGWSL